jgi:broad specificity phosphatase PhoE
MRTLRRLFALATVAACAPAARNPSIEPRPASTTTVVLVRHAEKAAEPAADPPLTAEGAARAQALVDAVRGMPVTAIISTDFARTRATAAPLAARLGLTPEIVDARLRDHARLVAEGVLARHRGETVVVVGHSNTVPDIVQQLGGTRPAALGHDDFGDVWRVAADGTTTKLRVP